MDKSTFDWIAELGAKDHAKRSAARTALQKLGPNVAPALVAGLEHENWRVRSNSAELLDHFADPQSAAPLAAALQDPIADVRRHALHSLICDRCKTAPLDVDSVGLVVERAFDDPSVRVRRRAVTTLAVMPTQDPRIETALEELCQDSDALLRKKAHWALNRRHGPRHGFPCPHCDEMTVWSDCRHVLRQNPHCFTCLTPLEEQADDTLHCPTCACEWSEGKYRQALKRRPRLPCPHCSEWIRKTEAKANRRLL